ncbi:TOMM precursor leader peptide-binding protein [Streptomyces sp. CNZ287]|uniref:TOMM precursor leader peptide-binding protein n=1 Tax=Streptomyces sp. B22F1 TaxID=3153566 RepID=UPI0011994124
MASAVRVTGAGGFGERTARLLAADLPDAETFPVTDLPRGFEGSPDAVVVVAWRPAPSLAERADELAHRSATPWLPVIMDGIVVRVGPLVRPPQRPCFLCYRERQRQHDRQRAVTAALHTVYDQDPGCGPVGHLPHHARLAAAVAGGALVSGRTGEVTTIRLDAWGLRTDRVVPTHGCPRCGGSGAQERQERLRAALTRSPASASVAGKAEQP